jgi:hypothetical protein
MSLPRWLARLEAVLAAVAFAEAGEPETARQMVEQAGKDEPAERPERDRTVEPGRRAPLAKHS